MDPLPHNPRPAIEKLHSSRLLVPIAAGLLLYLALAWSWHRPGPPERSLPIIREAVVRLGFTSALLATESGTTRTARVDFASDIDLSRLAAVALALAPVTDDSNLSPAVYSVPITSASLVSDDGTIRFTAAKGARLSHDRPLRFARDQSESYPGTNNHSAGPLTLRLVADTTSPIAFRCQGSGFEPVGADAQRWGRAWLVPDNSAAGQPALLFPIGQLLFSLEQPRSSRLELLAYLWRFEPRALEWAIAAVALIFAMGTALVARVTPSMRHRPRGVIRTGLGVALMFGAAGLAFLVAVPPLHGPDEQDHLLSYLRLTGRSDFIPTLVDETQRSHWDRIRASPFERFSSDDRKEGYLASSHEWSTSGIDAGRRSALAGVLWRVFARLADWHDANSLILKLRLHHLLWAGLALGLAAGVTHLRSSLTSNLPWPVWPLLITPAFALLAMPVSNYFLVVTAGFLFVAVAVPPSPTDRQLRLDPLMGALWGLALGIALTSSRSGLTAIGLAPLLTMRWLTDDHAWERALVRTRAASFWGPFAGVLIVAWLLAPTTYREEIIGDLAGGVPSLGRVLISTPLPFWIALAAVVGAALEIVARSRSSGSRSIMRGSLLALIPGILVVVLTVARWPWADLVQVSTGRESSALSHLVGGLARFLGSFGPGRHDFLLSRTFWGFGDPLSIQPPESVLAPLCGVFLAGFLARWWRLVRRPDAPGLRAATGWFVGCLACLSLLLLATRAADTILLGRYMVILFAVFLTGSFQGWIPWLEALEKRSPALSLALFAAVPASAIAIAVHLLLGRFA